MLSRDNIYGGKLQRIERQIHHYGSGLNALPLLSAFQASPDDTHLLRAGFGGISGPLSNIDEGGFASASFHSFADTLKWDGYSGDYGPNFVGLAMGTGVFLVHFDAFGWQAFGGEVLSNSPTARVRVADAVRRRIYVAPLGYLLALDAGAFEEFEYDPATKSVQVSVVASPSGVSGAAAAPAGRLVVTKMAQVKGVGALSPSHTLQKDAGAWVVPFTDGSATVELVVE